MEVAYYYLAHAMTWKMFTEETAKWDAIFMKLDTKLIPKVVEMAYEHRGRLAFKDHFRDYLIGVEASSVAEILITYNIGHFEWLQIPVHTPEEFVLSCYKQ